RRFPGAPPRPRPGDRGVEPPIPGLDLKGVHFLRLVEDGIAVLEHARTLVGQGRRKAVIIGGGSIGLEMAEALVAVGMEVAIVERPPRSCRTLTRRWPSGSAMNCAVTGWR